MKKFVRAQTARRWKELRREIRRAARNPGDPEAIHDVRVAVRRFLACLRTFAPFFKKRQGNKLRKPLRRLLKRCGEVRNRDIAIGLLRGTPAAAVLERQRAEREKALIDELRRARKHATGRLPLEVRDAPAWEPGLLAQVRELFARGRTAAAPGSTHAALHRFRLLAKRFRYTLEIFQSLPDAPRAGMKRVLARLGGLQDRLGAINDCITARSLVRGNKAAQARIGAQLPAREAGFRRYWKAHFGPPAEQRWRALAERIEDACKSTS
jgi:triphosphatase